MGMKGVHASGTASSGKIASTGHSGSQAPQSMHSSGSITSMCSTSWMQSTGQTSTQERSFVSMQGSVMMYVTSGRSSSRLPEGERRSSGGPAVYRTPLSSPASSGVETAQRLVHPTVESGVLATLDHTG